MVNVDKHCNSILVIGEVAKPPYFDLTKNGKPYARIEIQMVKESNYGGQEKMEVYKYTVVTYSVLMIEGICTKLSPGTVVAVSGTHSAHLRKSKKGEFYVTEINVPNPQWGGSIHILENASESSCSQVVQDLIKEFNVEVDTNDVPF